MLLDCNEYAQSHLIGSAVPFRRLPRKLRVTIEFTVVHAGARDGYQVPLALAGANMLDALVTDLMWSRDRRWMYRAETMLPAGLAQQLNKRSRAEIPATRIENHYLAALQALLLDHVPRLPVWLRRSATRAADRRLGRAAGRRARVLGKGLLTYSYYAHDAFRAYRGPGMLFQVHPHPTSIRRILLEELQDHPDCAASLRQEWELALPAREYAQLAEEPTLARHILCASSFTRDTLVENGIAESAITVIPYGVDCARFTPGSDSRITDGPLKLLFVGRINHRKGVKYLLQMLELLKTRQVELTVCGRVVDDLQLFAPYLDRVTVRPSVNQAELQAAYQAADLFVFPSVAEGFGQVLLESLASGLPILSTTHTAAPDLIQDGQAGFVVQPRRPDMLAEKVEWALTHRKELHAMRTEARHAAQRFPWERFRGGIVDATRTFAAEFLADKQGSESRPTYPGQSWRP